MNKRLVRALLAMGLVLSLVVSAINVSAFHEEPEGGTITGPFPEFSASMAHSYFPWVPNGADDLDGMGPFYGSVTIQNLEDDEATNDGIAEVEILVGSGDGWDLAETVVLQPHESITLSADQLGIPEGEGASVVALGYLDRGEDETTETVTCGSFADPADALAAGCEEDPQNPGQILNPNEEVEVDVEAVDAEYARIAGVVKNVSPNDRGNASTNANDVTVDGYSGLTGVQVSQEIQEDVYGFTDGTYILPIAQTNAGWNTVLRVANMSESGGLTNVTVTFYGSGQQGFAGQSEVVNLQIRPGDVQSIDLSDVVPEEWVGSAFITSAGDIGAIAERYKVSDQMLLTNSSRPEHHEGTTKYGALIFKEYNYWNTGISIANVSATNHNNVTVTYYGPTGNVVGQDSLTVPPRGMEFIYTPGSQDLGLTSGFVGSVKIEGTHELHAAIDQVKYFGNDPDVGQAMSYVAEQYVAEDDRGHDMLSMPLVQKGNPVTGTGDTSGIQLYNTSQDGAVEAEIVFYGANGLPVAPTVENNQADPLVITLGANQSYTLYTHHLGELSSGFQGSVVVRVTEADENGGLVGVSNNVNYAVQGDGSTAFPMVYSFDSQTP